MSLDTSVIGFGLIIIGLILQIVFSWKGRREIRKRSLIFGGLGLVWLFIDSIAIKGDKIGAVIYIVMLALLCILLSTISITEVSKNPPRSARRRRR